jgi:hypothetical protein
MKLADYFYQTVKENEETNENGERIKGWASTHYGVFSSIIDEYDYKKVAEVGIGYGMHAKYILQHNKNIEQLFLIDPSIPYENDLFSVHIMEQEPEIPGNNFNELVELIKANLSEFKEKYTWFRTKSLEITNEQIPDSSLDAVFIDGAHDFDNVYKDLNFWYKKVRKGGQILGDDYWMDDVKRAVHTFATEQNLNVDKLTRPNKDYIVFRFIV